MKKCLILLTLLLVIPQGVFGESEDVKVNPLKFAIVPQQAPSKLLRTWKPLLDFVSEESGLELNFATAKDIPTFEKRLREGKYDIAYMNPYHFTVYNQSDRKYLALAKAKDKKLQGILVTKKHGEFSTLTSLVGMEIAFPAPAAFGATVLIQASLNERNLSFTPRYVSSHDSVYKSVAAGIYPAGGGVLRTLKLIDEETAKQLRIIFETRRYTPHAIAVGEWIPIEIRKRLLDALIRISSNANAQEILGPLNLKGFAVAADDDWDDVRALHIEQELGDG